MEDNEALEKFNKNVELGELQNKYLKQQIDTGKTISEITNDFAHAQIANDLINGDDKESQNFKKELKEEKKEEIKQDFTQKRVAKQKETIEEKQKKAEAFYKSVRPILEFDFSNLTGVERQTNKDYKERSYGIPLMILMLALYTPLFCIISFILALFNGINAIFNGISTFGKIARTICLSLVIIIIICAIAYCTIYGIDYFFDTNILNF